MAGDSRTGVGKIQDDPGVPYNIRKYESVKKGEKTPHNDGSIAKGHKSQMEGLPMVKAGII